MLNIKVYTECSNCNINQCFYLKYGLFNGMNLKCLVLRIIAESFYVEKIQSSNLPQSSKIQSSNLFGWKNVLYMNFFQGTRRFSRNEKNPYHEKNAFCFIKYFGLDYDSDDIGFALLRLNVKEPTICYYDFEQQFSSTIKVKIPDLNCWKLKLCCSSIWILADLDFEDDIYKGIFIDVIGINSKIEWYHIRSNVSSPICLKSVFSGALLVADDLIDDINEDNDDFTDGVFFSSCKALYINQDNLIPCETNERNFIGIFKPKEFEMKNLLA